MARVGVTACTVTAARCRHPDPGIAGVGDRRDCGRGFGSGWVVGLEDLALVLGWLVWFWCVVAVPQHVMELTQHPDIQPVLFSV